MMLKKLLPTSVKLHLKLYLRYTKDLLSGSYFKFAKPHEEVVELPYLIELSQPIRKSYLYENKLYNLQLASQQIASVSVRAGQIFSFWHILKRPSEKNGYKKGRNIINNQLTEDVGGGLCQLSGIIYHLSLMANLTIIERHNHSKDIYTDETRFTPLGSDATVVYGYKDLRIQNNHAFPLRFIFKIEAEKITAQLYSLKPIPVQEIQFFKCPSEKGIYVEGKNKEGIIINQSFYQA